MALVEAFSMIVKTDSYRSFAALDKTLLMGPVMEWRHCWNFRFITFVSRKTFISLVLVLPPSIHRNTFFDNRKHLHGPKTRILIIFVELLRSVANG